MNDKLKQFIEDNREAFDSETPAPKLMEKMKRQLSQDGRSKKRFELTFMHWAAAVVGFIILSIVLYYSTQQRNDSTTVQGGTAKIEEKTVVTEPAYARQIDQYLELIGLQQIELRKVEKEQPELYRQFANDINQLDSAYRALKITLTTNPNRELLIEAMISNLQLQTELLNRQLSIIKEIKQKSKAHEKSTV
ncbi:MAG: hypothetical protein ACHQFX_15470 [Chitinophagales bacterium]